MRPTLMWAALLLVLTTGVSGDSIKENGAVSSGLMAMSCSVETLREEMLVERCFNNDDIVIYHLELKFVPPGTVCSIKCRKYEGVSYRLCDSEGYWTGPQLKCIDEDETSGQELRVKRGWRRRRVRLRIPWRRRRNAEAEAVVHHDNHPVITCYPADTPVIASEGNCDAVVTWKEATATDDHGTPRIEQTQPPKRSGDTFKHGTTTVIYKAFDSKNQVSSCAFGFEVKVVTCSSPGSLQYGTITCDPPCDGFDYIYGSKCTATCQVGHDLHGDAERMCRRDRQWRGMAATCKKVECPSLQSPANGENITCTDGNYYSSSCNFKCKSGFSLPESGIHFITCQANKEWSGTFAACKDSDPPVITNCPTAIVAYTDRSNDSTVGIWRVPVVTDNVDQDIKPILSKGEPLGSRFPVGIHEIEYTASDTMGNKAVPCKFTFIVQETSCPPVKWQYKMVISCPLKLAYGQSCIFSCEHGYDMIGPDVITCKRNDSTPAVGFWNKEPPYCDVKYCEKLQPPINGALVWENWIHGIQSRMYCNADYDIPRGTTPAEYYICDTTKGTWSPTDDVPDCTAKRRAGKSRLGSELRYFTGDCSSNETQNQIKQVFITVLNASAYHVLCRKYPGCGVDNVEVECGVIQERRKRHVSYKKKAVGDRKIRHRRGTGSVRIDTNPWSVKDMTLRRTGRFKRDCTHELFISFDFFIELRDEPDVTAKDKWEEIEATFGEVGMVTRSNIENGGLNLEIKNFPMQLDKASFRVDDSELYCPPGSTAQDDRFTCAVCPTGTYFDSATDRCVDCPVGSYNDKDNQTSCLPCPDGNSTLATGARKKDKCIAMCTAGSYSNTGLDTPCGLCAVGTYQPHRNMKTCAQCHAATTTSMPGSTALDDCQAFQVDVFDSDSALTLSPVVSADTASWSVTLLLKTDTNNASILSLTSSDIVFQLKNPSALAYDFNGILGSSDASLLDNNWHHVALVWDDDLCQFRLYKDGSLVASQDTSGQCNVILSSAATLEIGSTNTADSFGGSVTMLSVWNSALDDATISELSSSCIYNDTGASFRWQMIIDIPSENTILQVPSACDVTDNCNPDPCHGYRCEEKLNDFECQCEDGFTGKTCDIPPDYCADNFCVNNATCVRGNSNYTCQCAARFRGHYCQEEIVNGAYGLWSQWSSCTKTCEGGLQSRSRECNEPVPDPDGLPCEGPSNEAQYCNINKCPECIEFTRLHGMRGARGSCSEDSNGEMSCNITCRAGRRPNHKLTNPYNCGPTTNYVWSHQINKRDANLPSCTNLP